MVSDLEEQETTTYKPGVQEVIEELGAKVGEDEPGFERAMINRVSDTYYVCRIYFGADDEYEAHHLDFG